MSNIREKSRELCNRFAISPKKIHGQNFLMEEGYYQAIIEAAGLTRDDEVLEVGPGLGFLTQKIAQRVKKLTTVEIDDEIFAFLKTYLQEKNLRNVRIINEDILRLKKELSYNKIVANLPYNISAHFLRKFIAEREMPEMMVLMLQDEVVERICAKPGKMSILAVSVQFYANTEKICFVPKEAFWPEPKVNSAVVKLTKKEKLDLKGFSEKDYFRLVKHGFSSKRKMLKNNLAGAYHLKPGEVELILDNVGIDKKARAQDLALSDWLRLLGSFH